MSLLYLTVTKTICLFVKYQWFMPIFIYSSTLSFLIILSCTLASWLGFSSSFNVRYIYIHITCNFFFRSVVQGF
uniref:Uncharacterized protein n=1 Tax=Arundo donax TaxID=35708 RepID=A0A0A8YEB2_ARUDO